MTTVTAVATLTTFATFSALAFAVSVEVGADALDISHDLHYVSRTDTPKNWRWRLAVCTTLTIWFEAA